MTTLYLLGRVTPDGEHQVETNQGYLTEEEAVDALAKRYPEGSFSNNGRMVTLKDGTDIFVFNAPAKGPYYQHQAPKSKQ